MNPFVQVDVMAWSGKQTRIHTQLKDICAILSGLMVAQDHKAGLDGVVS